MDTQQAKKWLQIFNDKIQENKAYLSELDTPIGDGDHGANMARGMMAVIDVLNKQEPQQLNEFFKIVAMELVNKVGGASGPLYGSAFMGMVKVANQDNVPINVLLKAGLDMIQKRGKATQNEKTMVDVWIPVIQAIEEENLSEDVIQQAVNATKPMQATKGRASYLGERSIGHIDPGAYSSGLLFESLLEV